MPCEEGFIKLNFAKAPSDGCFISKTKVQMFNEFFFLIRKKYDLVIF